MSESASVYITYRRGVGGLVATALTQALTAAAADVLMDVEIAHGEQMETVLLNQVAVRPYFVLVLTPGTLEGCTENGDWLRMQIERAALINRSFIVLMSPNFQRGDVSRFLGNALASTLEKGAVITYQFDDFPKAVSAVKAQLRPVSAVGDTPEIDQPALSQLKAEIARQPVLTDVAIKAQQSFENAFNRKREDWDGRIADYTEALRLYPDFADAYARRGANWDVRGNLEQALRDCNDAIARKPYSEAAYVNRGIIRQKMNELNGATDDYSEALRLNPQLAAAYFNRGIARYLKGDYDGAIGDHSEAIRINPRFASYYYHRGLSKMAKSDFAGAVADYDEAARLNPNIAEVYYNRGLAKMYLKDYSAAVVDWSEAIKQNPNFVAAYYNRGLIRAGLSDLNGTIDDMSKVLATMPNTPEVRQVRQQIEEVRKLKRRVETGKFDEDADES